MSFSSGTYSLYATGNPVVTNTTTSSTWANNTLNDIATALSTCLLKDGTQTATASIGFAQGIDVTTAATTPSTTFACFNTNATTVNAFGAASVALNIGHASAAAAFAGGISIPTGKAVTGAGTASITGFATSSLGAATVTTLTASNANAVGSVVSARYNGTNMKIAFNTLNSSGAGYLALNANAKASSDTATYDISNIAARVVLGVGTGFKVDYAGSGTAGNDITWTNLINISTAGAITVPGHVAGTPTWVTGDKYLVVDASGNIHVSALGPAS